MYTEKNKLDILALIIRIRMIFNKEIPPDFNVWSSSFLYNMSRNVPVAREHIRTINENGSILFDILRINVNISLIT